MGPGKGFGRRCGGGWLTFEKFAEPGKGVSIYLMSCWGFYYTYLIQEKGDEAAGNLIAHI